MVAVYYYDKELVQFLEKERNHMKKKLCALLLVLAACLMMCVPVSAAQEETASPYYTNVKVVGASLSMEDESLGKLRCVGIALTKNLTDTIQLTMTLTRLENGYWTPIKSWTNTGVNTCNLSKAWCVPKGYKYDLMVTAKVYDENGIYRETASAAYIYDYT